MNSLNTKWSDLEIVAFDTETSGGYPVGFDVVEFGAVKYKNGVEVDSLQFFCKPRKEMSDFIIGIHGITNDMVQDAPKMDQQIQRIKDFFGSAVILAHHAPFDLGFIGYEFEKHLKILPQNPVLCTSLLSRVLINESPNHKLQTLIKVLKIDGGTAHRALDDARACLYVGLECMKRMGENATLADLLKKQVKDLSWSNYALTKNIEPLRTLKEAIETGKHVDIVYEGGTLKGQPREIIPFGIVRNPDGDYVQATCLIDRIDKRFYLSKITDCVIKY